MKVRATEKFFSSVALTMFIFYLIYLLSLTIDVFLLCFISRLLRVVYGPPEESDERQAQVTTLVNNLRNTEGDIETGPCGEH